MFPCPPNAPDTARVLQANRERLREVYQEILGALFQKIEWADQHYLSAQSFIPACTFSSQSNGKIPENGFCAAFRSSEPVELLPDGQLRTGKIVTAPLFPYSKEGVPLVRERYVGWMTPELGDYIQQYNRFVLWAIQPIPLYTVSGLLFKALGLPLAIEDAATLAEGASQFTGPISQRMERTKVAIFTFRCFRLVEIVAHYLNRAVFAQLASDILPDRYWQDIAVNISPLPVAWEGNVYVFNVNLGDSLPGISLTERLRTMANWIQEFTPDDQIARSIVASLSEATVVKTASHLI